VEGCLSSQGGYPLRRFVLTLAIDESEIFFDLSDDCLASVTLKGGGAC
jgi:hypothetical protein